MSESTVIKPRPGARQPAAAAPQQADADDRTSFMPAAGIGAGRERFRLPSTSLGTICDSASRLLSLADRLGEAKTIDDLGNLRRQCMELVRDYQYALKSEGVLPDAAETASYCVCALIDETILNTEWGQAGEWASNSLLAEFHSQTWAGTHFFELVEKARRAGDTELMTLQYLCLSLGFKGRFRVEENGQEQLDSLRDALYHQMCSDRGRYATPFDRSWESRIVSGGGLTRGLPVWVVAALCGVLLLLLYLGLVHQIHQQAQPVVQETSRIGVPEKVIAAGDGEAIDVRYLQQVLQTEMDRGLVALEIDGSRVTLLISSEDLFASGEARVREAMQPVLSKIARALETSRGAILVAGHSDNQPIATERYPSNWHLSLARATAVADLMAATSEFNGRLWPEGRGDSEPRFANDTPENRARNRRVEITLIP
ncbi:MAG: type VI secretion system protein TssL, long form [Marinobacter sp.]|nr:type VI secretion system protein TssL, long form [Marinobacter sp.]